MKKLFYSIAFLFVAVLPSCDEWDPVFQTGKNEPDMYEIVNMDKDVNMSIADFKALYETEGKNKPIKISKDIVIKGQVTTDDSQGNIYKSLYIQDETAAIELKIGKNGLYNDYKLGQWIYVRCDGLTLGAYNDVVQLGFMDPSGEYETSYLEEDYLINTHVFRGEIDVPAEPIEITESQLKDPKYFGRYVTVKGLKYGCNPDRFTKNTEQIFALVYVDQGKDHKSMSNRIFISGDTFGVTTWSMSKQGYISYLKNGNFDSLKTADGSRVVSEIKDELIKNAAAAQLSQYFLCGKTDFQIRTSGYCKFADAQIPAEVLSGEKKINVTGILGNYNGKVQFTLIDLNGVEIQ